MTKDEALKMAIEALDTLMMEKGSIYQQAIQACKEALERQSNMVTVPLDKLQDMQRRLKALEQPAQSEYVVNSGGIGTELRQPTVEQGEPVVWKRDYNFMRDLAIGCEEAWDKLHEQKPIAWTKQSELDKITTLRNPIVMWKNKYKSIENNIPLYTAPPQPKEWVGLSDEQIGDCLNEAELPTIMLNPIVQEKLGNFYKAIEAKLKELNTCD